MTDRCFFQNRIENGMESAESHRRMASLTEGQKALLHFSCGSPCECDHQNFRRIYMMRINQMCNSSCQHKGFPGARSREYHHGAGSVSDSLLLLRIPGSVR